MSLTLGQHPLVFIALVALALAGAWWAYRRTVPVLSTGSRVVLAALRFASLTVVLFLLAEPLLRTLTETRERPVVALLVDGSRSMDIRPDDAAAAPDADPGVPGASGTEQPVAGPGSATLTGSAETARRTVEALGRSAGDVDLATFVFGADASPLPSENFSDSLRFDLSRTDISRALESVRSRLDGRPLSAVVLVSDGRYNTGRNPLMTAERFPVPIFTATVGDTTRQRDVLIGRVLTNELAYKGVELPFEVGIRHSDFGGSRVTVTLSQDGTVQDQAVLTLPTDDGETTVSLGTTPVTAGLIRYQVSVTRLTGERTWRNNGTTIPVRVLESKKRILVVASAPSPDLSALRGLLAQDPDLEVVVRTQKLPTGYYEGAFPDPGTFDLLILAGFPGQRASAIDLDRLRAAAEAGKPLLFMLDRTTDQRALASLGNVLPMSARAVRPGLTEATFVPTINGRAHPILEFHTPSAPDPLAQLPPVLVSDTDWTPSPDAEVLASPQIRGIQLPDPLLLVRRRSGQRVAAILASGLWRWRNLPEALQPASGTWEDLVDGLVRWLSAPEDDRPLRVSPVRRVFDGSDPVRFTGQLYDQAAEPVSDAVVEVEVDLPDGRQLPIALDPVGNGRYTGEAGQLADGEYAFRATAERNGVNLGEDSGSFTVEQLTIEYRDTRADSQLMAAIAQRSGGAVVSSDGSDLQQALQDRGLLDSRTEVRESSSRLWQQPLFLLLVLFMLTAEWLIRKRKGLV